MENCHRGLLFLCLIAMVSLFGACAYAETVEEKKEAANYDETLQVDEEASAVDEVVPVQETPVTVQSAQAVVPSVQATPAAIPAAQPASSPMTAAAPSQASSAEIVKTGGAPVSVAAIQPAAARAKVEAPKTVASAPAAPQAVSKEMPEAQVFGAANPSGLVEVSGYKYPVFLFAPKDYKTDRTYAMIMIAPAENAKAEQQIETLTGLAQRKSVFLLAPYVLWPKAGDTPYTLDQWLLTVKNDVIERFPINKKRVYLIGKDSGAHYAAYLAVKHPKEFSAVALWGEAWDGPFSQLVIPRSNTAEQVPFYIALKADGDARLRNQGWFDKFQQKGYLLHLVDYKSDQDPENLEFKKSVFEWLETTSQSWEASVAKSHQSWKGKFKKGVKDFFVV